MPVATSYSELELAEYQSDLIGAEMQSTLGWTTPDADPGDYQRAVNLALRMAGLTDIADADDLDALEAAARVAVWTLAAQHLSALPRTATTEQGADLESLYQHAVAERKAARTDAMRTGIGYAVTSTAVTYRDAYSAFEDESA